MEIRIPANENFDFYACKKLYKKYQNLIGDDVPFNQIIKNTFFYSFYQNKKLIGCIYIFEKYKKLYMNGFAIRGFHNFNIKVNGYTQIQIEKILFPIIITKNLHRNITVCVQRNTSTAFC